LKSDKAALRSDISSTAVLNFDASISTATNYVTLNAAVQSFTAGSGNDTASISVAPTKVLDGGAGTDTLIYGGSGAALTASIAPNVKNFEVFQAAAAGGVGTVDMANFTNSTFASVVSASNSGTTTLSNVKVGTPLTISTASLNANALTALTTISGTHVYQTSDYNGAAGSVTVTLAGVAPAAANSGGTVGSTHAGLTLTDATTTVGIGTVNLVSNASLAGGQHVITTLTDPNMFSLNISGTGGVQITNHTNNGGSISIKDTHTGTGASGITTLTAANLASLAYDGTANYTIATIAGNAVPTLTISNTNLSPSTGLLTVGALTNATATAVFLNGAVALTGTFTSATKVVGGTNNANVTLTAAGGGAGTTITLGNGNNSITGGAGNDTITTGTGASTVTGAAGGDTITFGAGHTGVATVVYTATGETSSTAVSNGASIVSAAAGYDVITGLRGGDKVDLQGLTANAFTAAATALTTSLLTAGTNGDIAIVRGNWNSLTGYFTTSATGSDSLLQWDSNGTAAGGSVETIVLVGFANSATTSTNDGLITLG